MNSHARFTSHGTPNKPMQRAGTDKLHAPHRRAGFTISAHAPQGRRAVADGCRYATGAHFWRSQTLCFERGPCRLRSVSRRTLSL
jgi:hypothetical protein